MTAVESGSLLTLYGIMWSLFLEYFGLRKVENYNKLFG